MRGELNSSDSLCQEGKYYMRWRSVWSFAGTSPDRLNITFDIYHAHDLGRRPLTSTSVYVIYLAACETG